MNMTGASVKYLNTFHLNRTQSSCNNCFLNILQKYYQLHILGTLDMYGYLHQKQQWKIAESLMFMCLQKMNSISNVF